MGHFPHSFGNPYILVVVDYVSNGLKQWPYPLIDAKVCSNSSKRTFSLDLAHIELSLVMMTLTIVTS